jgi:antitoxin VapB
MEAWMATAKLFTHGGSQAVRLPKEFRFEGDSVRISRVGDRVMLEPVVRSRTIPWDDIDALGVGDFMADGRLQPAAPETRDEIDP